MTEVARDLIINFPVGKADECPIYYKNPKGAMGNGQGLQQEKCAHPQHQNLLDLKVQ